MANKRKFSSNFKANVALEALKDKDFVGGAAKNSPNHRILCKADGRCKSRVRF